MSLEDGNKPAWLSKGVWGGAVAAILGVLGLVGVIDPASYPADAVADSTWNVFDHLWELAVTVAGVVAVWGRWAASKTIG